MENPLYGDENSKAIKIATYTSSAIVILIGLVTFILLGVFTYRESDLKLWGNLAMMVYLIIQLVPLGILIYWQRTSYLEPKLRILMILTPILFVFGCAVALFYVFGTGYPGQQCFYGTTVVNGRTIVGKASNLYTLSPERCIPAQSCLYIPNSCMGWDENLIPRCGSYNATLSECKLY
ncbi:hypothetical protein NAEGRDRAFT_82009 [Naegleria gruberi]|uniref:Transmembrane protein n=1 Tax=Naegleria gruberi TaxID=5762 RepID=D2W195_NAEGR|nr:uncharacterized protein NAEGRDRAFT_82009 [Naegleria gruberi]EFC37189.1 hypothetical protein NAEGRDRAFT_82009 [Naegleria gruberi]|eukprot:XP_002669933.1 hypothetical protein NAEGRDRAFT_82009 [Naegleria gruberi strain NEG-M]